jgi:hypothetical protein
MSEGFFKIITWDIVCQIIDTFYSSNFHENLALNNTVL